VIRLAVLREVVDAVGIADLLQVFERLDGDGGLDAVRTDGFDALPVPAPGTASGRYTSRKTGGG
jgi:hypothetical protein